MAAGTTTKTQLVASIPSIMKAFIDTKLIDLVKFAPLCDVDTSLQGNAGDTLEKPIYAYIGEADDMTDGTALNAEQLTSSKVSVSIKQTGKAVEITDQALETNQDNALAQAEKQLGLSIADKLDNDVAAALLAIDGTNGTILLDYSSEGTTAGVTASKLSKEVISEAAVKAWGEDALNGEAIYVMVAPMQYHDLRLDPAWETIKEGQAVMSGHVGTIWGYNIIVSNRIKEVTNGADQEYNNFLVRNGALEIALKRNTNVEADRDILKKSTIISADKMYGVYLKNVSKAVKLVTDAD